MICYYKPREGSLQCILYLCTIVSVHVAAPVSKAAEQQAGMAGGEEKAKKKRGQQQRSRRR